MGWMAGFTREAAIAYADRNLNSAADVKLLATRQIGERRWYLIEKDSKKHVVLALIRGERGDYGVKFIDDQSGPAYYDCPLAWIDQCDATGPGEYHAAGWRRDVRHHHAKRKAAPEPETGMTLTIGSAQYRLHTPAGPRKGWNATRVGDGRMFRIPAAQLNRAMLARLDDQREPAKPDAAVIAKMGQKSSMGQLALSLD